MNLLKPWMGWLLSMGIVAGAAAQTLERLPAIDSKYVDARPVDVWLPPGYDPSRRYAVLYMHDGQMLFDAASTWNHQAWNAGATVARLMREGRIADTIIIGIWNIGALRYAEYYPQKFLPFAGEAVRRDYVERAQLGRSRADDYLRFIVHELKPAIDARYSTRPEAAGTFVMGSSMGGLISLYALCEYPQVFGGAAALSTHWVGRPTAWTAIDGLRNAELPLAAFRYLREHLPDPATHRLYMDRGTVGLDAIYAPHQAFVDELVRERGWDDAHAMSRVFEGADHTERDWAARLELPLLFLLARR